MDKIKNAAVAYSEDSGDYIDACKYDAFIAGAFAPETREYYRSIFSNIAGDPDCNDNGPITNVMKENILELISEGKLLGAVKYWKECNPGMGLKEAKDYVDSLRNLKS